MLVANEIVLDPSRVAAQIVSGIGFLGAGLIFVRRDSVRGLTTAACSRPAPRVTSRSPTSNVERGEVAGEPVAVSLEVHGSGSVAALAADLGEIDGVHAVAAGDVNEIFEA